MRDAADHGFAVGRGSVGPLLGVLGLVGHGKSRWVVVWGWIHGWVRGSGMDKGMGLVMGGWVGGWMVGWMHLKDGIGLGWVGEWMEG